MSLTLTHSLSLSSGQVRLWNKERSAAEIAASYTQRQLHHPQSTLQIQSTRRSSRISKLQPLNHKPLSRWSQPCPDAHDQFPNLKHTSNSQNTSISQNTSNYRDASNSPPKPQPQILNPRGTQIPNPQPSTLHPQPSTLDPQPLSPTPQAG